MSSNGTLFGDLANLINNAEVGSTITLDRDYGDVDNYSVEGIKINKNLTIDGAGHTLDAMGHSRIFLIQGEVHVELKNLNFINGYAKNNGDGGAVLANSVQTVTVRDSAFYDNTAERYGGALYYGTAINCNFTKNSANQAGGATYNVDAILCTFEENNADVTGTDAMAAGSRLLCKFGENQTCNSTLLVPTLQASQYVNQSLGSVFQFDVVYDDVKYDGVNVKIELSDGSGVVSTFYGLSGKGWVVDALGHYNYSLSATDFPEVPIFNGTADFYDKYIIIINHIVTGYNYVDAVPVKLVSAMDYPLKNLTLSVDINGTGSVNCTSMCLLKV